MKLVYTHDNRILVENAKNVLEQNGINVFLKNEFLEAGIGELSAVDTWPELWVQHDEDVSRAKEIIAKLMDSLEGELWICSVCGEQNEPSFEVCWQCGQDRG